jgi:hypothetical protein
MYPQGAIEVSLNSTIVIEEEYLYHFLFGYKARNFNEILEILTFSVNLILCFEQYAKVLSRRF